ncbi:hypothetical protein [Natronoarchaeum philippinense]|uniref:hypothetical protein n=1 Tax=Natronoarchaeum philippinense TaxID=558529 RepID=UPI000BE4106E|nr:hypothetical protein [Natronoarchaeum philippinense]
MLREIAEAVSKGKLLAVLAILLGTISVSAVLSTLGKDELAVEILIPVFVTAVLFAIKRELGIFGTLFKFE